MAEIDNDTLKKVQGELLRLKTVFKTDKGPMSNDIVSSLLVAIEIIENYHLAYWQYGKVEDYYSCERCGHVIDWHGMPLADLPDRCSGCGNYMHKKTRPDPAEYPEVYQNQIRSMSFVVDKIEKIENASCENCEHAYQGADPLKIIRDSKYLFYCAAGHAYGGPETVCSEWRRKEGDRNERV